MISLYCSGVMGRMERGFMLYHGIIVSLYCSGEWGDGADGAGFYVIPWYHCIIDLVVYIISIM